VGDYEAILSMACGAGIQYVAEKHANQDRPAGSEYVVFWVSLSNRESGQSAAGVWNLYPRSDRRSLPDCRCAKSLLNGPCGGLIQRKM